MQQGHQHPAAGRADRVAKGDGAAVDVDPGGIPAQFPTHRQGLRGEGLVGLDQVQLLQAPAGLVERATGGGDRADAHDRRVDPGAGVAGDPRQHRQAQGLGLGRAHQQYRGGAVVEAGGVAGGDAAVLPEGRLELGQGLDGGAGARLLVGIEAQRLALALRDLDRRDLVAEAPALDGGDGLLLRSGGEGVLLLAGQAVLLRQVLGGDAHVVVVEGVPQAVLDHAVDQLRMAHAQAGAGAGHDVGRQAHVLLAAGDDHLGVAAADRLGAQVQGLEAGAADLVQGHGRHADRQAGLDRRLARRVLPGPGGEHLAEDDFVDLAGIETGLFEQAADYRGAQLGGGNAGQRALEAADGGTGSGDDDDVLHGWFSWIRPWPGRIAAGGRRRCDSLLSYALWKGRSARPAPCVEAPAARAAIQKLISGTCSGTISLPAVFATISSTLTPGARSRRMKAPSSISR
ncbi:hypothetical protein PAERUG_P5_London_26_VIM_2_01_09_02983 [Pseudomonas aeruginosa]|nr:hypothetical protein PAERUG_P33_London_28_VIM_2_02_12_06054 [Pseudomonas aeruginosa]CRR90814.1 hypothetical protein PAERUG_P5_London_26_VIM_2_01_09_02983 [Pseudomonas aeruginosa]